MRPQTTEHPIDCHSCLCSRLLFGLCVFRFQVSFPTFSEEVSLQSNAEMFSLQALSLRVQTDSSAVEDRPKGAGDHQH